jgi:hypothetical protein
MGTMDPRHAPASSPARHASTRERWRVGALTLALALGPGACATHEGAGWGASRATPQPAEPSAPTTPTLHLFAFGDAGAQTRSQRHVTSELDRLLTRTRANGEIPIVLWLGNHFGDAGPAATSAIHNKRSRCAPPPELWRVPERAELAAVIHRHQAAGLASFAVLGPNDWQCDAPELIFRARSDATSPQPWIMPTYNYVVQIDQRGDASVISACTHEAPARCTITRDPASEPLLELVFLDTSPWNQAQVPDHPTTRETSSLGQQRALLQALTDHPAGPLRVLVTHHPIESAGPHGQGGLAADSAFFYTAPELRAALDAGLFAGVISAHDRDLQVSADISDGVKRSSRYWLDYPVFQIVAGASATPDGRPGAGKRGWRWYKGQSLIPDLISAHAGFAELVVSTSALRGVLHARRRGRWRVGEVSLPRDRARHPEVSPSPGLEPCIGCNTQPPRPR